MIDSAVVTPAPSSPSAKRDPAFVDRAGPLPRGSRAGATRQLFRWVRAPIALLEENRARYGDVFTMRFPGYAPIVMLANPDAIREVFVGDPNVLRAGEANIVLRPLLGEGSLLSLDGPQHLRERRLMLPAFHGERMQTYAAVMAEVTAEHARRWPRGRAFAVHEEMQGIALDIILRTVFGLDDAAELAELRGNIIGLLDILKNPVWLMPWFQIDLGPLTPWARAIRLKQAIDVSLFRLMRKRRSEDLSARTDILSMLLSSTYDDGTRMTDFALRDEMMTLLVAGHETTASSLSWALYHILSQPEVHARIKDELASAGPAGKLPYLDAAIKETLRLTPVIPLVGRVLAEPLAIGGHTLPAGVMVTPCIYLMHRDPRAWPEPARFRPERFLEKVSPYEFLPFGGGARRCIGASFALFEMRAVLAEVLSRLSVRLEPGYEARIVRRAITFVPSRGVPLIVD